MIGSSDGQQYESEFDLTIGKPIPPEDKAEGASRKTAGASKSAAPITPGATIDRGHHVPLVASALTDKDGQMYGMAIDHRIPPNPGYEKHLWNHEAFENDYMNDLVKNGMSSQDAYHKAHDWSTARESAAVTAEYGEKGLEDYKQHWRDAASIAAEPTDRPRHPDAHTTKHGLDEAELGTSWQDKLMHIREAITGQKQPTKEDIASGKAQIPTWAQSFGQAANLGMMAMGEKGPPSLESAAVSAYKKFLNQTPLQRAVEHGYTTPTFHGARQGLEGTSLHIDKDFYSSTSPELASEYANTSYGSVTPLLLNTKNYHVVDARGEVWAGKGIKIMHDAIDHAINTGKDGVIVRNIYDEPAGHTKELGEPKDVYISLNKATVRSWFAQFDPAKMHLNDLLASGLAIAVPAGAALQDKDK
jgi:hypothetical protein